MGDYITNEAEFVRTGEEQLRRLLAEAAEDNINLRMENYQLRAEIEVLRQIAQQAMIQQDATHD